VAVIAYLVIFKPETLLSNGNMSYDILSAIVFIVAGPALGLTLSQLHRGAINIYQDIKYRKGKKTLELTEDQIAKLSPEKQKERQKERIIQQILIVSRKRTAQIKLNANEQESNNLARIEAFYDFSMSTGLVFLGLFALTIFSFGYVSVEPWMFIAGGIILSIAAYIEFNHDLATYFELLSQTRAIEEMKELTALRGALAALNKAIK
jgi:hypothetical protein